MVDEFDYKEPIIHYNTDSMVCPHCGHYYYDCSDFEKEEDMENCVNCGEQFKYRKNIFVTWDTDKV
jgi:predicted RNA-binding Zn-ribbon protein involved in translation (DUF1610 family)